MYFLSKVFCDPKKVGDHCSRAHPWLSSDSGYRYFVKIGTIVQPGVGVTRSRQESSGVGIDRGRNRQDTGTSGVGVAKSWSHQEFELPGVWVAWNRLESSEVQLQTTPYDSRQLQTTLDDSRWLLVTPDDSRWLRPTPTNSTLNDSKWLQTTPDESRRIRTPPDASRRLHTTPEFCPASPLTSLDTVSFSVALSSLDRRKCFIM